MENFKRKQLGVTMLELIVSLGIGVILLTALGRVYVSATNEDAVRTMQSELDEAARQIFSTMARDISLAGFVDNFDGGTTFTGQPEGNKILITSKNIKSLFNRESNEVTALSLLTGKKYMLPIQGNDERITLIYQAANSKDGTVVTNEDYRSLSGAIDNKDESGWGKNCINRTNDPSGPRSAFINHEGKEDDAGLFIKQDFVFNKDKKTLSCGMAKWTKDWETKKNKGGQDPSNLIKTNDLIAMVGSTNSNNPTQIDSMRFRYTVTNNKYKSSDDYTVAESISGYYADKLYNYKQVQNSDLGWGGVTGVEVCVVLAVAPTFSKKKIDVASVQPKKPTCERENENVNTVGRNMADENFLADVNREDGDRKFYARYVRLISAHNALYLR